MNKEQLGETIRFSIRLPKEQHKWLKNISDNTRGSDNFISMNTYISKAIEILRAEEPSE